MDGPCMHVLCKEFYENIYHIFVKIVTVHSKQWMGQIGCLWPYKKLSQQFKFTVCTKTNPHCIAYYWAVKTFSKRILWCPYVMVSKDFRAALVRHLTAAINFVLLFTEMLYYVLGRLHSSCVLCTKIGRAY
mgnify:CR=1 FL=1